MTVPLKRRPNATKGQAMMNARSFGSPGNAQLEPAWRGASVLQSELKSQIQTHLSSLVTNRRIRIPITTFPQSSDVLASLYNTGASGNEVLTDFRAYFQFGGHSIFGEPSRVVLQGIVDDNLVKCLAARPSTMHGDQPLSECAPRSCVTFATARGNLPPNFRRLLPADLVWLFYYERMGVFRMLNAVLRDFAHLGRHPIPNDDLTAFILETMVRTTNSGLSSRLRDRDCAYRRCLGWTSKGGRRLGSDAVSNVAFNSEFHRFLQLALQYYKEKRLAVAVRGTAAPTGGEVSTATLVEIGQVLDLLNKSFAPFEYGRNHYDTLAGILWAFAGLAMIRNLAPALGIPATYSEPHQYVPAAYDVLVARRPITPSEVNRYATHHDCALAARTILLDIPALEIFSDSTPGGSLETWLGIMEEYVEKYRTAYRSLTGVDLAAPSADIEQAA